MNLEASKYSLERKCRHIALLVEISRIVTGLVAILVILALLAGCGGGNATPTPTPTPSPTPTPTLPPPSPTPTTSFRVPIFPNDSSVVVRVVNIRRLTGNYPWEIDVEILDSYDVPGYYNVYKTKIGQVVTVLTLNDVSQLKGQVINASIRFVGDERWHGTVLSLRTPTTATPTPSTKPTPTPTPQSKYLPSFTDDTGQVLSLLRFPQRIVSLGPKITEILVALGASEKIVGVDDFSQWPSTRASIPRLGEPWPLGDVISPKLGIDTNTIVALHPDLVIADFVKAVRDSKGVLQWDSTALTLGLKKAGITVVYLNPVAGVTGALKLILYVGAMVGEWDKAEQLVANYEKRRQAVVDRMQNLPKVRVVLARGYGGGPPAPGPPVTEDDPLSELIQLAGGVNVFSSSPEDKKMVQKFSENPFTLEPYIAKNPEVILVLGGLDQMQLGRPGWEKVEAVQKGRVYPISEITPLTVLDRLEEIARLLHPT